MIHHSILARLLAAATFAVSFAAQAVEFEPPKELPEPGTWALIAVAAVVAGVASRKRKK